MTVHALTTLISCESLLDLTPISLAEERRFCRARVLSTLQKVAKMAQRMMAKEAARTIATGKIMGKKADLLIIDDMMNFPLTKSE